MRASPHCLKRSDLLNRPNKVIGVNSRPVLQFESHGHYQGGVAVAQLGRSANCRATQITNSRHA